MQLELNQDPAFSLPEWRVERVGWTVIGALVLAALAGLAGPGPLSLSRASLGGGLTVTYQRFARYGAPGALGVDVTPASGDQVEVLVDQDWLSEMDVTGITPAPARAVVQGDNVAYTFDAPAGEGPVRVSFSLTVRGRGPVTGHVTTSAADSVSFWQFLCP